MKRRCSAPLVFALLAAVGVRAADRSATLLRAADGGRRMFVRNGTLPRKTGKNLRLIRGATAEGPTARKVGGEYRVHFDQHRLDARGLVRSPDLTAREEVSDQVKFPAHARHGGIVAGPRAVIGSLRAAWPDAPPARP